MGAWIEIYHKQKGSALMQVAPLVGAWIEIDYYVLTERQFLGRSPCGSVD